MGSLEEEELVQMVHDFIESESSSPILSASSKLSSPGHQHQYNTLQEILRSGTEAEREVLERVLKDMKNKREVAKTSGLKKWLVMRLTMDGFKASLCHSSWVTTSGCTAGDYEYIDVNVRGLNGELVRLIVDIDFKSQFELARPTPTYKELTETLPSIFVGTEENLNKVISLVCSAAKHSLRERGFHIPPWRTITYMQSKWLSDCHNKAPINATSIQTSDAYSREIKNYKWVPPVVKPKSKRKNLGGGGSALSSQFSNLGGINCC